MILDMVIMKGKVVLNVRSKISPNIFKFIKENLENVVLLIGDITCSINNTVTRKEINLLLKNKDNKLKITIDSNKESVINLL